MKKRRFVTLGWIVFFMIFLVGCGARKRNSLLQDAADDINYLWLYTYDGESGNIYTTQDAEIGKEILTDLSDVVIKENEDWSYDKLAFPIYGLEISDSEGNSIEMAWSNGYCITMDGSVYTFDYDFEKLISACTWDETYNFTDSTMLPCARELSISEGAWITRMLVPAKELAAPEGISMILTEWNEKHVSVELINNRAEEWGYSTHYSVQVLLDGVWYGIPEIPGEWMFPEIAIILPAGGTNKESYDLERYGELPKGTYRLVKEGMAVEFIY